MNKTNIGLALLLSTGLLSASQNINDNFENISKWKTVISDGVKLNTQSAKGYSENCIVLDYNFTLGSGYCGIQAEVPIDFPENYQFTFWIKSENALKNNLEFKLEDSTENNVWWSVLRNYSFPTEWKKITVKARNVSFAWGPTKDKSLKKTKFLQFIISSVNGGKGKIYIDNFEFKPLPKEDNSPITFTSGINLKTTSRSYPKELKKNDDFLIRLDKISEIGGISLTFDKNNYPVAYQVETSDDLKNWEKVAKIENSIGGTRFLKLPDVQNQYIRLSNIVYKTDKIIIDSVRVFNYKLAETPEDFFGEVSKANVRGIYPRYFERKQNFWTVVGVSEDDKEGMISVDGQLEIDKLRFSLEPFIKVDNKVFSWANTVKTEQYLKNNYLPIPSVIRKYDNFDLNIQTFAFGKPDNSYLLVKYTVENKTDKKVKGNFYVAGRPFQVNPPWQFLNWKGGVADVKTVKIDENSIKVDSDKEVIPLTKPLESKAYTFNSAEAVEHIYNNDENNGLKEISDNDKLASFLMNYQLNLAPKSKQEFYVLVPFYKNSDNYKTFANGKEAERFYNEKLAETIKFWTEKLDKIKFSVSKTAEKYVNTAKSNLAYILINRDKAKFQPGSRSYERSWMRDGSLGSSALLKLGLKEEVKKFINWYSGYVYESGKVPCVVDTRGPDPVPENDSHGQLIFAIMEYYRYTQDKTFLEEKYPLIKKVVNYIETLINERKTDNYKDTRYFGLVPESISHEGYSEKPMHSYWDDFFILLGLKNAVQIAKTLNTADIEKFTNIKDDFQKNLYNSINRAIKETKVPYIPGCAELGDFDATSTAIAIYPCGEVKNLPTENLKNTFDIYYKNFVERENNPASSRNYTPYEIRNINAFTMTGKAEIANEMLKFFMKDRKPANWNHWAEVVWGDTSYAAFIGDMPHTWVGSDYVSALRNMIVYEDLNESNLIIANGINSDWFDKKNKEVKFKDLFTEYGKLDYSYKIADNFAKIEINGKFNSEIKNIKIRNLINKTPKSVSINGKQTKNFDSEYIVLKEQKAVIEIKY